MSVRVAVVGAGAWGINHVRTFARAKGAELVLVCDSSEKQLARAKELAPGARLAMGFDAAIAAPDVEAIVLATPAVLHAAQAKAALEAGKHVFVEKPLALHANDAEDVVKTADRVGKIVMVGHLMLYHPVMDRLKSMIAAGELGQIYYLYAQRLNLGRFRRDENAMWSLAPHDISMILALVGETPQSVSARGGSYLHPGVDDVVFMNLRFQNNVIANIHLSWLDPRKERRLTIVGSKKMVEFDDMHPVEKLRIYDKGFDRPPEFTEFGEYLTIRSGDVHIPHVPLVEPLSVEARHFIEAVAGNKQPLTDGASGLAVVKVLEAGQRSLAANGTPIEIR